MTDHQQTDWIGYSEFLHAEMDVCPVCKSIILNLHISAGRPSVYCSDSCKMKAYRQRGKALRNYQDTLTFVQSSRSDEKHCWYAELHGHKFMIMYRIKTAEFFVGYYQSQPFGYVVINSDIEPVFNRTRFYKFDDAVQAANDYYQSLTQARILSDERTTEAKSEKNARSSLKSVGSASNTHTKVWYPVLFDEKNTHTKGLHPVLNANKGA